MSKLEELKKELDEVETSIFYNNMVDRWGDAEFRQSNILHERKRELEKQIEMEEKKSA